MLYYLFEYLDKAYDTPLAGLFQYISFRAAFAIILSLMISMVFGGRIIKFLRTLQIGETVRDLGLEGQKEKEGTPTMGGVIIIMAILIPCLLIAKLDNVYILLMILSTVWMGIIGFADDYIKVFRKNKEGLRGKFKILGQVGLGLVVGLTMFYNQEMVVRVDKETAEINQYEIIGEATIQNPRNVDELQEMAYVKHPITNVPFYKENEMDYSKILWFLPADVAKRWSVIVFVLIVIFIVTAVSNAANLTDGIDGLATGVSAIIGAALGILAYVSGNAIAADYLNILFLPNTGELVVFTACFLGACIGFLWHNSYPAQVFMGDTGSLTIGGIIAVLAILIRKEFLIPILCGIFVVENLSVMLQVGYFKYTKKKYGEGKRIFLMSPLHHHYQKLGMHESKIVTRFWIVGILLAVLAVVTLKIR